jgi:hypothetical protein
MLILLGAGVGGLFSGLLALYFVATRAYRRARNLLIFGLGYIFLLGTSVGSLLLMFKGQELLGVAPHTSQDHVALYAYTASLVCGALLVGWSEIRWRRSVGLHDKTLLPTRRKE